MEDTNYVSVWEPIMNKERINKNINREKNKNTNKSVVFMMLANVSAFFGLNGWIAGWISVPLAMIFGGCACFVFGRCFENV